MNKDNINCLGSCMERGNCTTNIYDWLKNIKVPKIQYPFDVVEVKFKNNRKNFYKNINQLELYIGDVVAVEATKGHDIGTVSLTGELVRLQMKKKKFNITLADMPQIYRIAKGNDIKKWERAIEQEKETIKKAKKIVLDLGLEMKIYDVEYQGDMTRATFYYIADDRIDFRELIKILADTFKIRVEMRQFGYRQEASHIGGVASCGNELCCATWLTDFKSISTNAIYPQQLSSNPIKLTGQCSKLKCCLKYELDVYVDALKDFPDEKILLTEKGEAKHQKTDVFKRIMWYAYQNSPNELISVNIDEVKEIIALNKQGIKPIDISNNKEKENIELSNKKMVDDNIVIETRKSRRKIFRKKSP